MAVVLCLICDSAGTAFSAEYFNTDTRIMMPPYLYNSEPSVVITYPLFSNNVKYWLYFFAI